MNLQEASNLCLGDKVKIKDRAGVWLIDDIAVGNKTILFMFVGATNKGKSTVQFSRAYSDIECKV